MSSFLHIINKYISFSNYKYTKGDIERIFWESRKSGSQPEWKRGMLFWRKSGRKSRPGIHTLRTGGKGTKQVRYSILSVGIELDKLMAEAIPFWFEQGVGDGKQYLFKWKCTL